MTVVSGPVPVDSHLYISRDFEGEVWKQLTRAESVLLLGPRQHGKTSCLLRLKRRLAESGLPAALIDLQRLPANYTFVELLEWFALEVASQLGVSIVAPVEVSAGALDKWVGSALTHHSGRVVLLIDEASAITDDGLRNAFYAQVRAFNAAAKDNPLSVQARVTFLFSGTFRPELMVHTQNSPFNTCAEIECDDLSVAGVRELLRLSSVANYEQVADVLFAAVGGQPHLIQLAAQFISDAELDELSAAEAVVEKWKLESNVHADSMFRYIREDLGLRSLVDRLVEREPLGIEPGNGDYKFSRVIGVCRRSGGELYFRNQLFAELARSRKSIADGDKNSGTNGSGGLRSSSAVHAQASRVISVHGIRTRGKWQKDLSPALSGAGFTYEPLDFGSFGALMLLIPFFRRRKVKWLRDELATNKSAPSVIAHSFGSYLVAKALEMDPHLKFGRIILCGSIVRRDFPWHILISGGRVEAVLNCSSKSDLWPRVVTWLVPDAGPSGTLGFNGPSAFVFEERHAAFGHSGWFYSAHYAQSWIPFLSDGLVRHQSLVVIPLVRNWRFTSLAGLALVGLTIIAILVLF